MIDSTIGHYTIIEELGRGGMAVVYRAHDPRFDRDVALKVLPREFLHDPTFQERFVREARAIAQLEHPAIVSVYDFGEDDGQPYFVMRYMPGGSLASRIAGKPLPLEEVSQIINRIGSALDAAHVRAIIHRDVKPGNILFDHYDEAYLSDFGIVRLTESTSQLTGSGVVGTPAYMAPELASKGGLTASVDIYALGVTLYQLLTGFQPFEADTPMGLIMAHVSKPVPDIRSVRPDLPENLQLVINQALAKDPNERYQSAGELADGLHQALSSSPHETEPGAGHTKPGILDVSTLPEVPPTIVEVVPEAVKAPAEPKSERKPNLLIVIGAVGAVAIAMVAVIALILALAGVFSPPPEEEVAMEPTQEEIAPEENPSTVDEATDTPIPQPTNTQPSPTSMPTEPPPSYEYMTIGYSVQNRSIDVVRVGNGGKAILLVGGIHAGFTPGSVTVAEDIADYLVSNLDEVPDSISVYVVTSLNPDAPHAPGELAGRLNANGVDLNRNWDCNWSATATWQTYSISGGTSAFSEPETRALRDLILDIEPVATIVWGSISSGGLVSAGECYPNSTDSLNVARVFGNGAGYNVDEFTYYDVTGGITDWMDSQGYPAAFVLPDSYTGNYLNDNLLGVLALFSEYK